MQFERDALDEIAQIVGTANDIGVRGGGWAAHGDRPLVGVAFGSGLLLVEKAGRVPEDNRAVYAQTLFRERL